MRGIEANGDRVRELRKGRGWTQEELAAAAGCSARTIRHAEQGKRIDVGTLSRIAATLTVSLAEVLVENLVEQQRNIEIVHQWLRLWVAADVEGLLKLHHPETTLELPGAAGMPAVSESGRIRGLDSLREHFTNVFSILAWDLAHEEHFDAKGDLVFHRSENAFHGRETGKSAVTKFYNEFQFEEGLIVRRMTISDLGGHRQVLGME